MVYAGIGSRETPSNVLEAMKTIAKVLALKGASLRSGGAPGADAAFEVGCDNVNGKKEIFLPWKDFNDNKSSLYNLDNDEEADKIAAQFHPNWEACSNYAKKLLSRNVYQILGRDLTQPVDFVVCWTKDGELVGGTAQAIRIAEYYWISIYNLGKPDGLDNFRQFFKLNFL